MLATMPTPPQAAPPRLDPSMHPDIIDEILAQTDLDSLFHLRTTSIALRQAADTALFRHIMVIALPSAAKVQSCRTEPERVWVPYWVPGAFLCGRTRSGKGLELPGLRDGPLREALSLTRLVTIVRPALVAPFNYGDIGKWLRGVHTVRMIMPSKKPLEQSPEVLRATSIDENRTGAETLIVLTKCFLLLQHDEEKTTLHHSINVPLIPTGVRRLVVSIELEQHQRSFGASIPPLECPDTLRHLVVLFTNSADAPERGPRPHDWNPRVPRGAQGSKLPCNNDVLLEAVLRQIVVLLSRVSVTIVQPPVGSVDGRTAPSEVVMDMASNCIVCKDSSTRHALAALRVMTREQYMAQVGTEQYHLETDPW